MPKRKKKNSNGDGKGFAIWALVVAGLALILSFYGSIYLPYIHEKHRLSLMVYGFNYISYVDSMGIAPEHRMRVDLVFTNNGNRMEAILGARFVLPMDDIENLTGYYWCSRYQPVRLEPFMINPGEIRILRLDQPIDNDAIIGHRLNDPLLGTPDSTPVKQLVSIRVTVRDPDDNVPREHVIPIMEAFISSSPFLSWNPFSSELLDSPFGGVVIVDNLFEGGSTASTSFSDAIQTVIHLD